METLHMQDVIRLLGLPAPPAGKSSYYIPCPCCDDKPKSRHLNINLQKNVFRCPRCGFSGGVLDLYAFYAKIPREKALEELLARKGRNYLIPGSPVCRRWRKAPSPAWRSAMPPTLRCCKT